MKESAPLGAEPMHATVSVVIPHYNHGDVIGRQLAALATQTRPAEEIIVVDDASTDGSVERISELIANDAATRLVRLDRNRGTVAACNAGLSLARGKYICFPAADDEVGPEFLERAVALLESEPSAAFLFADSVSVRAGTGRRLEVPLALSRWPVVISPDGFRRILARSVISFSTNTNLFRRDRIAAIGGMPAAAGPFADTFCELVLAFRFGACYLPGALGVIYDSPGSYSNRTAANARETRAMVEGFVELAGGPAYRDIYDDFRRAAVLPSYRPRVLLWLWARRDLRPYLSAKLVRRVAFRSGWALIRPVTPVFARRWARVVVARLAGYAGRRCEERRRNE